MKHIFVIGDCLADEPMKDLAGRTPLEAARTPHLDRMAREGQVGRASFVHRAEMISRDAACLATLGYNPAEFYTGIAPLESVCYNADPGDGGMVFRADLVTLLDDALVDQTAGWISDGEAGTLVSALLEKIDIPGMEFKKGSGYKNFLVIKDPALTGEMRKVTCPSPSEAWGHKASKHFPRGKKAKILKEWMDAAKAVLEAHEVNRVRIDLGENPGNFIWFWGEGASPKMPSFQQLHGKPGMLHSETDFAKGLAKLVGLSPAKDIPSALNHSDLLVIHQGNAQRISPADELKNKIKRIEELDAVIGTVLKENKSDEALKICVTTDLFESTPKKKFTRDQVPFLIWGAGVAADEVDSFSEKAASQSRQIFEEGYPLMDFFVGGKK